MERPEVHMALLRGLGAESFRHINKEMLVDFVDRLPTVDPQVALQFLAQIPHLTKLAAEVVADNADAHKDTHEAHAEGATRLHEQRMATKQALVELLARDDVSPGERLQYIAAMCDVDESVRKDLADERLWFSELFETRLKAGLLQTAQVALMVLAASRSGGQQVSALSRLLPTLPKG
jgi:hypothetical protein